MSQDKLSLVKKFRLSPREASMLADKAQQAKVDAFESKFSQPSHKVFKCPKCGTNNRVPVRNKRIEISCRCGHKYTVMC